MSSQTDTLLDIPGPGGTPIIALPEPQATTPASQIDPTLPVYGNPTTQSVRQNFATAQVEITGLMQLTQGAPFLPTAGGHMTGPMYLYNDPTDVMMPATKGYVDAHGGGGSGGGGIPEAPSDGSFYTRSQGAWVPGVALSGGPLCQMTADLLLAGNPTNALGATPKQYVDVISATANGAVQRGGDTMTGLLVLSGDPTAPLGATTKQYTDAADNLRAPINNPTFTGTVNAALRTILSGASGPSIAFIDTTASRPIFAISNNNSVLGISSANATTGAPTGANFAQMDQSGNWTFNGRVNATSGRIISTGATNPAIAMNNTNTNSLFCLYAGSGVLNFGVSDPNGVPQSGVTNMDVNGNWYMNGSSNAGGYYSRGGAYLGAGFAVAGGSTGGGYVNIDNGSSGNLNSINLRATTIYALGGLNIGTNWITGNGWVLNGSNGYVNIDNGNSGNVNQINLRANSLNFGNGAFSGIAGINASSLIVNSGNGINYAAIDTNWIAWQWDNSNQWLSLYVNSGYHYSIPPSSSDPRLKSNIAEPTVDALATIKDMTLHQFDMQWKPPPPPPPSEAADAAPIPEPPIVHWDMGFMSDQLRELIPSSVVVPDDPERLDTVLPLPLIAYAYGAIQQLAARVEALEGKRR